MPIAMKKTLPLIYILLILGWLSVEIPAFAQENGAFPQVKRLSIGPHPEHTRILVELSEAIPYTVSADFVKKKITLTFDNATAGPNLVSRATQVISSI